MIICFSLAMSIVISGITSNTDHRWQGTQTDLVVYSCSFRLHLLRESELLATLKYLPGSTCGGNERRQVVAYSLSVSTPPPIIQACAAVRCLLTVSRPKPSSRPISMYVRPWA